ncbi:AlpA family transcriptional regulator [Klebsiella pneumoniae]|jgi:predicted DNA-binding transcriptional regulator AlpA|nr:AlpA family transcriptional regulator [Klebsiella pneumoniae]MBZ6975284.1 AlpA family transcriptional regulator [Klebsiella grimontii]RFP42632.1 AlpA family transcriptional regulator [Klebsiella oxytoca]MBZ7827339.1 AlpA family transcriptional regulator [Klebsiella grimontii]RFP47377.1 AlpA family transcriptional regulator [Klebsiella oxytoca]
MAHTDVVKNKLQIPKSANSIRNRLSSRLGDSTSPQHVWGTSVAPAELVTSLIPNQKLTDTISQRYNNDDILIDMKYIVSNSGLTNKFFYAQIKKGLFPSPIKLGRSSRWKLSEYEQWIEQRANKRGQ